MTGIERLREVVRELGRFSFCYDLYETLADIADQIERELSDERDRWEGDLYEAQVEWNRVAGVCLEMERHCLYNEDTVVRDVERWARELRHAMKSDASDEREAQNPSCADLDGAADVTSDTQKVTRDPAADVSVSAYDLLPADEREAIAWVREHGGLDSVKKLLDWVVGHCSTRQQLDFDFWLSGRVMHELGFDEDMADRDEVERRLLARLMPEGMEWLVEAWPRFEDDAPLKLGDMALIDGEADMVEAVQLWIHGRPVIYGDGGSQQLERGERVKRPVADTWERLEEDAEKDPCGYFGFDGEEICGKCPASGKNCEQTMARDLVRRCRALAERERGE